MVVSIFHDFKLAIISFLQASQAQNANAPAKSRQGKGSTANAGGDNQIVVLSTDNMIEEGGVVIEQESVDNDTSKQSTATPVPTQTTRSRKQDLGSMVSNDNNDKEVIEKRTSSRRKQEIIPISTRPTRSSTRNLDNVVAVDVKDEDGHDDLEDNNEGAEEDLENDDNAQDDDIESKIIEITGEDYLDDVEDSDPGTTRGSKRGRASGRASRSTAPTGNQRNSKASGDESTSPARKSARIARK